MIEWYLQVIIELDVIFLMLLFFSEKNSPSKIIMWALVFLFLPLLGFIIYLFVGQTFYSENIFKGKGLKDDLLEKTIEENRVDLDQEPNEEYRNMMKSLDKMGGLGYSMNNDVRLYTLGEDKFKQLYEDLRTAKESIHLEYYIIRNDELGNELMDILIEKVKEGVEVKLLTDDFGVGKGPKKGIAKFRKAGGEFAVFHKVAWLILSPKKNNRNHRKIAVIDGKVAYCGGFNIGDEYLGKGPLGFWRDTAVRITGDGVIPLQLRFQMDWEYATNKPLDGSKLEKYYKVASPDNGDARVITVSGGPDVAEFNPVRLQYLYMINNAKKSVYLHTPYFIPDDSLQDALTLAAARGVDVKIIIPDKPDHMFVYWNNIRNANYVMRKGVKVYMYNRGFVHSKTMVVDGEVCSVGSANFDDRSLVLNFETNAVILSPEIGKQMDEAFLADLEYCTEYSVEQYESITGYEYLRIAISNLFGGLA